MARVPKLAAVVSTTHDDQRERGGEAGDVPGTGHHRVGRGGA